MNLTATLFGQMITFAIFIGFTMKFVWPPIMKAMEERQTKIADGLAAGERGARELEMAKEEANTILAEARSQASQYVEEGKAHGNRLVTEAKTKAREEAERLIKAAEGEIERERAAAKEKLRGYVASLAVNVAEKIIECKVDEAANQELLDRFLKEIG